MKWSRAAILGVLLGFSACEGDDSGRSGGAGDGDAPNGDGDGVAPGDGDGDTPGDGDGDTPGDGDVSGDGDGSMGGEGGVIGSGGGSGGSASDEPGCLNEFEPSACSSDEDCNGGGVACLRGVCIRLCGESSNDLDAAIGEDFEFLGSFCSSRYQLADIHVTVQDGCETARAYYLAGGNEGDDVFSWNVWQQALDPFLQAPQSTIFASGAVTRPGSGATNGDRLPLHYLPSTDEVIFSIDDDQTFAGNVYRQAADSTQTEVTDVGYLRNFSLLDEMYLLVDKPGASPGIELVPLDAPDDRARVVATTNTVDSIAVLEQAELVLFGVVGDAVYSISKAELIAAFEGAAELDPATDEAFDVVSVPTAVPFAFRVLSEELFVTWVDDSYEDEVALPISIADGQVLLGSPLPFSNGNWLQGSYGIGEGRYMFSFFSGTLFARRQP